LDPQAGIACERGGGAVQSTLSELAYATKNEFQKICAKKILRLIFRKGSRFGLDRWRAAASNDEWAGRFWTGAWRSNIQQPCGKSQPDRSCRT
jgi:hypothetical protein